MADNYGDNTPVVTVNVYETPGGPVEIAGEPVMVFDAATIEEAEVVRATLQAAGIPAFFANSDSNPAVGAVDAGIDDNAYSNRVYVAGANAEEARAILNEGPMSEEELTAAEEADPTTLEQAEAEVKNA